MFGGVIAAISSMFMDEDDNEDDNEGGEEWVIHLYITLSSKT